MRKAGRTLAAEQQTGVLLVLALSFLLGGIAGCMAAKSLPTEGIAGFTKNIQGLLTAVRVDTLQGPGMLSTLGSVLKWPVLVLVLSAVPLGRVGIPALFFLRGFLLSFCISVLASAGEGGMLLAVLMLGMGSILSVPVLFILGTQGLSREIGSRERGGWRREPPISRLCLGSCAVLMLGCILWERTLPTVLSAAANLFPT